MLSMGAVLRRPHLLCSSLKFLPGASCLPWPLGLGPVGLTTVLLLVLLQGSLTLGRERPQLQGGWHRATAHLAGDDGSQLTRWSTRMVGTSSSRGRRLPEGSTACGAQGSPKSSTRNPVLPVLETQEGVSLPGCAYAGEVRGSPDAAEGDSCRRLSVSTRRVAVCTSRAGFLAALCLHRAARQAWLQPPLPAR